MLKTRLFNINELSMYKKDFEVTVKSHRNELVETIYKIVLFVKYDKRRLNHWAQKIYSFTGGLFKDRPKIKPKNKFADRDAFVELLINETSMHSDNKTYDPEVSRGIFITLLSDYKTARSDFRNEDYLNEHIAPVMKLRLDFLRECCKYLGENWPLTRTKIDELIQKYFGFYITEVKDDEEEEKK